MSQRKSLFQKLFGWTQPESDSGEAARVIADMPQSSESQEKFHNAIPVRSVKYQIGQVVRHRIFDFRGVIFDVDPVFSNSEEWYEAIPEEVRPSKDQPYYHLFAENERTHYIAYVSEQNLVPDESNVHITHPDIAAVFDITDNGYVLKTNQHH